MEEGRIDVNGYSSDVKSACTGQITESQATFHFMCAVGSFFSCLESGHLPLSLSLSFSLPLLLPSGDSELHCHCCGRASACHLLPMCFHSSSELKELADLVCHSLDASLPSSLIFLRTNCKGYYYSARTLTWSPNVGSF